MVKTKFNHLGIDFFKYMVNKKRKRVIIPTNNKKVFF